VGLLLLLAANATADLTICADRPSKANGACTVPAGHWQLEVSGPDWARTTDRSFRTDLTSIGSAVVKLGLDPASDIEMGISPYVRLSSRGNGLHTRASGFGDVIVRYKHRLTQADAKIQIGLIPFTKIQAADHHLGNGRIEGGIIAPLSFATRSGIALTTDPEVDVLADTDGHGYHAALTNLLNVGFNPSSSISLSAELWNDVNFDPERTVRQWSIDGSAAYVPGKRIQLDAGANFGLNRATPDIELYAGASVLF
jgi:Putative MetA-pathway of phenol degradation